MLLSLLSLNINTIYFKKLKTGLHALNSSKMRRNLWPPYTHTRPGFCGSPRPGSGTSGLCVSLKALRKCRAAPSIPEPTVDWTAGAQRWTPLCLESQSRVGLKPVPWVPPSLACPAPQTGWDTPAHSPTGPSARRWIYSSSCHVTTSSETLTSLKSKHSVQWSDFQGNNLFKTKQKDHFSPSGT